jgi:hypothetical protein
MPTTGSNVTPEVSILFKQFLETVHPSVAKMVSGLWKGKVKVSHAAGQRNELLTPDLRLHCPNCEGPRTFRCSESYASLQLDTVNGRFVLYVCGDCHKATKLFSLSILPSKDAGRGTVYKYGENPPFGVPVHLSRDEAPIERAYQRQASVCYF